LLSSNFDHDAFMHHALHVLDAPVFHSDSQASVASQTEIRRMSQHAPIR